jgi:hypothetical protein
MHMATAHPFMCSLFNDVIFSADCTCTASIQFMQLGSLTTSRPAQLYTVLSGGGRHETHA